MILPAEQVKPRRSRRVALAAVLTTALLGTVAIALTSDNDPSKMCMSCKMRGMFTYVIAKRDPVDKATPFSKLIELPKGCLLKTGLMTRFVNKVVDTALNRGPWPTPPSPRRQRKPVLDLTGTSLVLYNKSWLSVTVGHIEIGTCWIPGPKGNHIIPDFIATHITNMKLELEMKYYMEQEVFGFGTQVIGGGTIRTTVEGAMMLNHISLLDFNNTIRDCTGLLASTSTKITGLLTIEEYPEDPEADDVLIQEICYGPTYWDDTFGPRPVGLVEEINYEIRRRFYDNYIAPPPSPPPPFSCDCGWTLKYSCPHFPPAATAVAVARDDESPCYRFCCEEEHFHDVLDLYESEAAPYLEGETTYGAKQAAMVEGYDDDAYEGDGGFWS